MWAEEIAKRAGDKCSMEVRFEVDGESGLVTEFNSSNMSDEQLMDEVLEK